MSDIKSQQPSIRLLGIVLSEAVYRLKEGASPATLNGEYDVQVTLGFNTDTPGQLDNFLGVQLKNKLHPDVIEIAVRVHGKFEGDPEFVKKFAPDSGMILFPYVRTYVQTLTGWGPMNPVILPPMNVTQAGLDALKMSSQSEPKRSDAAPHK